MNESENDDHDDDNDDDDKDEDFYMIKQLNNYFKTIDKAKSFEEQIIKIFNNKSVSNIDDNVSVNESVNESENDDHDDDNDDGDDDDDDDDKDEDYYIIKQLNNYFKTIDKTKSFEEQIELLKKETF